MKTIPGFPDYQITKDGRVWSNRRGIWLKSKKGRGCLFVILSFKSQRYTRKVHRLVLETFVGLRPKGMECRHLDGDYKNNTLENLCWGTRSENFQDSVRLGVIDRKGENGHNVKLKKHQVMLIRFLRNAAKFSLKDLAWQFDVAVSTISSICNGQTWKHLLNNG